VGRDTFSGLYKLKYIFLSQNNLQFLHPDTFSGLPNLKRLILYNNPGLHIPTDRNFISSHSLTHLDISHSNFSSVSVETFANISALEWLGLSDNNLRTVDKNILKALSKLSTLYLCGNPLHCDYQLKKVWRCCKDRNMRTLYGVTEPECDTPSEVKGMSWRVLEKVKCLEGNIEFYADHNNPRHNYIETKDEYNSDFLKQYEVPEYAVPFIFGTTGNLILLIIITCNKDMRTVPDMYILNLAISDIILVTVLFFEAYANRITESRLYEDFICTYFSFCRRVSVYLPAYSVALISIQRYRVTVNQFYVRVSSKPTWRGIVATIFGMWIVAALFAVLSAVSSYQCVRDARMTPTRYYKRVVIFELLASCVLPLCVIAFTYIMTARYLMESTSSVSEAKQNPQMNKSINTAKILLGLTVVFLISYVPYHVFWTYIIWTQGIYDAYSSIRNDIVFELWNAKSNFSMFSFKKFLSQSCSSVLYHFPVQTAFQTLLNILLENKFLYY